MFVWKLKDSGVELRLQDDRLLRITQQGTGESVDLAQITSVSYAVWSERPAVDAIQDFGEETLRAFPNTETNYASTAAATTLVAAVTVLNGPFVLIRRSRHFVHVSWSQDGRPRESVYQLSRKDCRAMLLELNRRTGLMWSKFDPNRTNRSAMRTASDEVADTQPASGESRQQRTTASRRCAPARLVCEAPASARPALLSANKEE